MPLDSKHPAALKYEADYTMVETIMDGERSIKAAGETFLPKLTGQTDIEYNAYKARGSFYNAFARTVTGLVGTCMRKEATISNLPPVVERLLPSIGAKGVDFQGVTSSVIESLLKNGRKGVLVDAGLNSPVPYFAEYSPMSIVNWRSVLVNGREKLTMLVLREVETDEGEDEYQLVEVPRLRLLRLDSRYNNRLTVQLFRAEKSGADTVWTPEGDLVLPSVAGKPVLEIPFVFFGAAENSSLPSKPPLIDLANLNISHWQLTVDYHHGLHMCGLPTPVAIGFNKRDITGIGPGTAWVSEDPNADAKMLEFTGQGLGPLKEALQDKEKQMAVMGSRMLEERPQQQEAFATVQLRQGGDVASLARLVAQAEQGMEQCFRYACMWANKPLPDKIDVQINKDFVSTKLTAQEITALVQARQAGEISQQTFLWNLKEGEVLPPDVTIDQEIAQIAASGMDDFSTGGESDDEDLEEE